MDNKCAIPSGHGGGTLVAVSSLSWPPQACLLWCPVAGWENGERVGGGSYFRCPRIPITSSPPLEELGLYSLFHVV